MHDRAEIVEANLDRLLDALRPWDGLMATASSMGLVTEETAGPLGALVDQLRLQTKNLIEASKGELMRGLYEALPAEARGACADSAGGLVEALKKDLKDGDIVMVKGSNGSKVAAVVKALNAAAIDEAARSSSRS